MATKTKKRNKRKSTESKKSKNYSVNYLVITLAVMLFLEGALAGIATTTQTNPMGELLDLSAGAAELRQELREVFQPMIVAARGVNTFYGLAATQMMFLIDLGDNFDLAFIYGINDFYQVASQEIALLLDASNTHSLSPQVSGIFIER